MKRIIVFLVFFCAVFFMFAQNVGNPPTNSKAVWTTNMSICIGDSSFVSLLDDFDSVSYCVYSHNGIYDTSYATGIIVKPDTNLNNIITYVLESVNGEVPVDIYQWVVSAKESPTISIPTNLVKHVTCPDGYLYPYMDGSFHVDLDNPVQDYEWIKAEVDTPFFFVHTFYDSLTLTGLRGGTYHVVSRGTNGCEYHDSVFIEQPDPWVDLGSSVDTICYGATGCVEMGMYGGTPPYNFTWFYYSDTGQVFMPDTTRYVCGLYGGGVLYFVYMYDSKGCKFLGDETEWIFFYLFEHVEDSISLSATNSRVCYGGVDTLHAQSIGYETGYMWHVGNLEDSVNYSTWIETDSVYIAEYLTPPMTESTWLSVDFSDQHGCVTHDSVWVEVYNPDVSMTIQTSEIFADSTFVVYVSPPGGDLYIDDALLISSIPAVFTVYTDGISVGPHILKYAGVFGSQLGLACEDEISIPIQVETNPFVTEWEYNISIYPNPVSTTLNLSSTGTSDFELSILDMTGKVIKAEKMLDQTFTFDVSDLASGIYMLRLVSRDGASKIVKFVKR